ncbi:MAG: DUF1634 domain-containing protein [Flavobacteriaceae bacterium]|jgi:uncharacterized membrane protein|nr:DUF1634 domain-containing protein [Flavobacteriaceae bacterium]
MMKKRNFTDLDLKRSVGNLLRTGVVLSVATSLIGFVKLFLEGFKMPKDYSELAPPVHTKVFHYFWISLSKLEGMGIIQLGILFLIITPVMRIIFVLIGFLKEKDFTYVIISFIVLGIIVFSFAMGYG